MTKHNIASSGSAEPLCQKIAASAKKLKHRKVTRSFTLDVVLWREIGYVAMAYAPAYAYDSGYRTVGNFLEQYAPESLQMVAELRAERAKKTESKKP